MLHRSIWIRRFQLGRAWDDLVARMTLDEKLAQLGSYWIYELLDGLTFRSKKAASC